MFGVLGIVLQTILNSNDKLTIKQWQFKLNCHYFIYDVQSRVYNLFIKNSLKTPYFHPYFLPNLCYNNITVRKKQPFDCFFVHLLWAVSIKAIAVALITSRERSSQL